MVADRSPASAPFDPAAMVLPVWAALFTVHLLAGAWRLPIGNLFDEIQHYSFAVALAEHPTLFPLYGSYRVLAPDLVTWTTATNHLAHPPLYHLLMTPLTRAFPRDPLPLRLVDVALVIGGLTLTARTLAARLVGGEAKVLLVILVFGLSETTKMGALVNNDDLLVAEVGLLLWAWAGSRRRPLLAGLVLAAIGWTKLNGFVAAGTFLAVAHLFEVRRGDAPFFGRTGAWLVAGAVLGAVPTAAVWLQFGTPVWLPDPFPDWFLRADDATRAAITPGIYAAWFFHELGARFPFVQHRLDVLPLLGLLAVSALAALPGGRGADDGTRDLARAGVIATAVVLALVGLHGWSNFRAAGILSEAQPRYFLGVWPVFAFAVVIGLDRLPAPFAKGARRGLIVVLAFVSTPLFALWGG